MLVNLPWLLVEARTVRATTRWTRKVHLDSQGIIIVETFVIEDIQTVEVQATTSRLSVFGERWS